MIASEGVHNWRMPARAQNIVRYKTPLQLFRIAIYATVGFTGSGALALTVRARPDLAIVLFVIAGLCALSALIFMAIHLMSKGGARRRDGEAMPENGPIIPENELIMPQNGPTDLDIHPNLGIHPDFMFGTVEWREEQRLFQTLFEAVVNKPNDFGELQQEDYCAFIEASLENLHYIKIKSVLDEVKTTGKFNCPGYVINNNARLDPIIDLLLLHDIPLVEFYCNDCPCLSDAALLRLDNVLRPVRSLSIEGSSITDAALEQFATFRDLQILDVSACENITAAGLQKLLPNLSKLSALFFIKYPNFEENEIMDLVGVMPEGSFLHISKENLTEKVVAVAEGRNIRIVGAEGEEGEKLPA
ncbi:MAG: hypothetical protein LBP65_02810 [Puniceicoccales bacterium]|jgi:hypothetical protein|nr:hypothetical protein [Puniceicoccales bacterium]